MSDFETELRTMLRERAADIATLPAHLTEIDAPEPTTTWHHRRTGWLIAAAVAAVLAIAGTVWATGPSTGHRHAPPATHAPSPNATRTPSPALSTCGAILPSAWTKAITNSRSRYGAQSAIPLAVSPDGSSMLVARDFGTDRDVILVNSHGVTTTIWQVAEPDVFAVSSAGLDAHYALINVSHSPRGAQVVPAIVSIVLIRLSDDHVQYVRRLTTPQALNETPRIDGAVLWNGHVYWNEMPTFGSDTGAVRRYDIGSSTTTTVATGKVQGPTLSPGGVVWHDGTFDVARDLPAPVQHEMGSLLARNSLNSDGTAYAWFDSAQHLRWWAPGHAVRDFALPGVDQSTTPALTAVAGDFVVYDDYLGHIAGIGSYLVDVRTGARAVLPVDASVAPNATFARGVIAGIVATPHAPLADVSAVRLDATKLPPLRC